MTKLLTKTKRDAPAAAESRNAQYLTRGGFVYQEAAGIYSWLPLGLRVLRNVERIIREEMTVLGAQELLMPALLPKDPWIKTGRWDSIDVMFKVKSQTGQEYALGPTHEEIVTPLVGQFISSYKDLPVAVFQIQTKFRDELRAKSGILRGREFGMKDLYSFHATREDLERFYQKALEAYLRVYERCGLQVKVVEASGGAFTKKFSHEFHVLTKAGEDLILACPSCTYAQNTEIATVKEGDACPSCGAELGMVKGIEAGNIFDLGSKFADDFELNFTDEDGKRQQIYMGCYGIGTTRLVGSIVEALSDDDGCIWPKAVAPYPVHLVTLRSKDETIQGRIQTLAEGLEQDLEALGIEMLWDDREETSPGAKFADADLIGVPLRLVISEKSLAEESVEWKERDNVDSKLVKFNDIKEDILSFVREA